MYAPLDFTALHYSQTHKEAILWRKTGADLHCVFAYCDMIKASEEEKKKTRVCFVSLQEVPSSWRILGTAPHR